MKYTVMSAKLKTFEICNILSRIFTNSTVQSAVLLISPSTFSLHSLSINQSIALTENILFLSNRFRYRYRRFQRRRTWNSALNVALSPIHILPDLPDATVTFHGGQTGLKVFFIKKTYSSPQFSRKWRSSSFFKMLGLSDEAVTISFGKWFQLSHTLIENANLPISNLNLYFCMI